MGIVGIIPTFVIFLSIVKVASASPTTMMRIRKQDESVDAVGRFRPVVVYSNVREGPEDDVVKVVGLETVKYKPKAGYFYYDPDTETKPFDAVHCFGIVRSIKTMFDESLAKLKRRFDWSWGSSFPLKVVPRFREETIDPRTLNARYDQANRRILFDVWAPPGKEKVYLSQSYDIVGHETGHAILDGLVPEYLLGVRSGHVETGGLHESFGDLTVIFSLLWQFDVVESIIVESRGGENLMEGFWNIMGEHFGEKVFGRDPETQGIRNLNNTLRVDEIEEGARDGFGVVFTSSIFASLVKVFEMEKDVTRKNPADTLYEIGQEFLKMTIRSFLSAPRPVCTLKRMARQFMKKSRKKSWKRILRDQFSLRGILEKKRKQMKKKKVSKWFCKSLRW